MLRDCALHTIELDPKNAQEQHRKMDFGLGDLLKYFDEHFGKRATRVFVGFLSLAVVGFCCHLIWEYILSPVYRGSEWLLSGHYFVLPSTRELFAATISGLTFILVYGSFVLIALKVLKPRINEYREEVEGVQADIKKNRMLLDQLLTDLTRAQSEWERLKADSASQATPPSSTPDKP